MKSETVFLVGKFWLKGQSLEIHSMTERLVSTIWIWFHPSFHELHRVARELCKSDFSNLKSKLREVNPSVHCTESFIFVAKATALASSARVYRGETPYDWAKKYGEQKVMDLLHPVPRWKAVEEWWWNEHRRQQTCVNVTFDSWPCWQMNVPRNIKH